MAALHDWWEAEFAQRGRGGPIGPRGVSVAGARLSACRPVRQERGAGVWDHGLVSCSNKTYKGGVVLCFYMRRGFVGGGGVGIRFGLEGPIVCAAARAIRDIVDTRALWATDDAGWDGCTGWTMGGGVGRAGGAWKLIRAEGINDAYTGLVFEARLL